MRRGTELHTTDNATDTSVTSHLRHQAGDAETSYDVFPGVQIVYSSVHSHTYNLKAASLTNAILISHCLEGRLECEVGQGFYYLTPGDVIISTKEHFGKGAFCPLKHYHGLSVIIDLTLAPPCFDCFMKEVDVKPYELFERICVDSNLLVMRAMPCLEHIFSELYTVPECVKKGYLKLKVLELLLFLTSIDPNWLTNKGNSCSASQVRLAKSVFYVLGSNMAEHITIEQLSKRFEVSPTHLKNSFKGVYGCSIYAYMRHHKMEYAKKVLEESELTILEIAGQCGYDNGSKFAKAFFTEIGQTPSAYRKYKRRVATLKV